VSKADALVAALSESGSHTDSRDLGAMLGTLAESAQRLRAMDADLAALRRADTGLRAQLEVRIRMD
jgi:hypothetical protein